ncbi:MAG: hypothetical protein LBS56_08540 [Propionibacteriaceae bacterium]|nr:hypothetical protein [Propionibacteriaceae bacterium]
MMVRSTYKKGVLAALASVALLLGLVGAPPAQAASTDPDMMAYSNATFVINNYEISVPGIQVGPTTDYSTKTYFSTEDDAETVSRTLVVDDGLTLTGATIVGQGSGAQWATGSTVTLPNDGSYGAASVRFCNPLATGGTCPTASNWDTNGTNISIVRRASATIASVKNITVVVHIPSGPDPAPFADETIPSAAFDEANWGINYPTGFDAIVEMASTAGTGVTGYTTAWSTGLGYQLTGLTVGSTTYDQTTGYWTYSVQNSAVAEVVGADVYRLLQYDTVTWTFTLKS